MILKLLNKFLAMIIILLSGIFITCQVGNKNKKMLEIEPKDKYQVEEQNIKKPLPSDADKDLPNISKVSESPISILKHDPSPPHVFYYSPNQALKQVALTFDDGPDLYYTPQILDILRQNNVKATFFIVGLRAQAHPEMVRSIVSEGHSIGNHTWDHPTLSKLSSHRIKEEVQKTEQVIYNITGFNTAMFRPPYGKVTVRALNEISSLGYSIIDWSVDTRDWDKTPVSQIMNYVSKQVYSGGIILQHCAGDKDGDLSNTVKALPQIISLLKSEGYSFVMVQDLLDIPGSK